MAKISLNTLSEDALNRAVNLFWQRGYFDTSIEDLVEHAGLHRQAIYSKFGGKRALFQAVLRRYQDTVTKTLTSPLCEPAADLHSVSRFFGQFRRSGAGGRPRQGCLMALTASEVSPHEPEIAAEVAIHLDGLRDKFLAALRNAQCAGQLRDGVRTREVADFLVSSLLGLMTLSRSSVPDTTVAGAIAGIQAYLKSLKQD